MSKISIIIPTIDEANNLPLLLSDLSIIQKKGEIINKPSQIIDLIKYKLNNNDYLMIKGSNSTGLFKFVKNIKNRKLNAL